MSHHDEPHECPFEQIINGHLGRVDPLTRYLLTLFFTWLACVILTTAGLAAMFTAAPFAPWAVVALGFGVLVLWAFTGAITQRIKDRMEATR